MHWNVEKQFYLVGYYDVWVNKEGGFGIETTGSNDLMSLIHNSKLRMPVCLDYRMADAFLGGEPIEEFTYPAYDPQLLAVNLEPHKVPLPLF